MGWRGGFLMVMVGFGTGMTSEVSACSGYRADTVYTGESIGILVEGESDEATELLERAIAMWEQCRNYGRGFPRFVVGAPGSRVLRFEFLPAVAGEGRCGSFGGNQIRIWGFQRVDGEIYSCGDLVQNLAHELGHALGLGHAPVAARCQMHVMSWITPENAYRRAVQPGECQAVGQRWLTPYESSAVRSSVGLSAAVLTAGHFD